MFQLYKKNKGNYVHLPKIIWNYNINDLFQVLYWTNFVFQENLRKILLHMRWVNNHKFCFDCAHIIWSYDLYPELERNPYFKDILKCTELDKFFDISWKSLEKSSFCIKAWINYHKFCLNQAQTYYFSCISHDDLASYNRGIQK